MIRMKKSWKSRYLHEQGEGNAKLMYFYFYDQKRKSWNSGFMNRWEVFSTLHWPTYDVDCLPQEWREDGHAAGFRSGVQ